MDAFTHIGETSGFGCQADMQKLLTDKNAKFLQFEQEAAVQYKGLFLTVV